MLTFNPSEVNGLLGEMLTTGVVGKPFTVKLI